MSSEQLKNVGLKVTLPRVKILHIFETFSEQHLSAEDISRQLASQGEDVGLATIYRVLAQFESAGLVKRLHFEGGTAMFELSDGNHHDHLVCSRCGAVEEFFDELIEKRQTEIAAKFGYAMTDHTLNIYGICSKCRSVNLSK